jgi:hypothetical protein
MYESSSKVDGPQTEDSGFICNCREMPGQPGLKDSTFHLE